MNTSHPVWRSLLYVPANNPRFIAKAHLRGADGIILDLEDSVPNSELDTARRALRDTVVSASQNGADVLIRINDPDDLAADDIDAAVFDGVAAILVTKARDADHVRAISARVAEREADAGMTSGTIRLVPMIETAAAYFKAVEIGAADPRNVAMNLGGEDFAADMGLAPGADTLALAKQQVAIAARATGLMPMGLMGTVADFLDREGIKVAAETARRFGMEGASCVHPSNVPILNAAFSPSSEEIDNARRVVDAYADATAKGSGAITVDGKMIDVPVVQRAEKMLARWAAIEGRVNAG